MKEVHKKCFAGPFTEILFEDNYVQSPIGLVPKAGGKARLIFHLSYNISTAPEDQSINSFIPQERCSVKYNDLDAAIKSCLEVS